MPIRLLLVLLLATPVALPAADGELLDTIVAAQQGVERVQGRYRHSTRPAEEPEREPNVYVVAFYLELPDRYHLCYSEVDDPDAKEWWLSDGQIEVHAEQIDPQMEPIVSRKPADGEGWGFQRVSEFLLLDRAALERDFELSARPPGEGAPEGAAAVVELVPRGGRLAEEVQTITLTLDDGYRTRRVEVLDQKDNLITIEVLEADYATAIDPAVFTWAAGDE